MWDRRVLKDNAKANLKKNYWPIIGANAIYMALVCGNLLTIKNNSGSSSASSEMSQLSPEQVLGVFLLASGAAVLALFISVVISIFVKNPIHVGYSHFLLTCDGERTSVGDVFTSVKDYWASSGAKLFVTNLINFLFYLLLIVPGIIKTYSYRLVPYLLAENPELSGSEARAISTGLMEGNKWNAFVLDLSFIGWFILSGISMGVLGVFYVVPYFKLTEAELFKTLSRPQTGTYATNV